MHSRSLVLIAGISLSATIAGATEPDSYGKDMFDPPPDGSDTDPVIGIELVYRPRFESSPRGPIRFDPRKPNTEFSHRARLITNLAHKSVRARFAFQNVYTAGTPEAEALVENLVSFVELGDDTVRSRIGRQQITFGTGRVLTAPNWSQRGRPIDAIRVDYRGDIGRADLFVGRHNGSGIHRDMAGASVGPDLGSVKASLTALLETNRFIPDDERVGLLDGYTRFTGGLDFELQRPLIVTGEGLVQLGSYRGDASIIGGPVDDPTISDPAGGNIRAWMAAIGVGYDFGDWLTAVAIFELLSGDRDLEDETVGVFDTVLGYRRRFYGRIDRYIRLPSDTRSGGLVDTGVRTRSALVGGTLFTEWHYFQIPATDLDGRSGPSGVELDLRYVYPITDGLNVELAYLTFATLGDYRTAPGSSTSRNVNLKHYTYVQLDLQI